MFPNSLRILLLSSIFSSPFVCSSYAAEDEGFAGFSKGFLNPQKKPSTRRVDTGTTTRQNTNQTTEQNFCGFRGGFLNSTPQTRKPTTRSPDQANPEKERKKEETLPSSKPLSLTTPSHEENSTQEIYQSLWKHPYLYTKEARQEIYAHLPPSAKEAIQDLMEEKLDKLLSSEKSNWISVCKNPNFLTSFLAFKYLFDHIGHFRERAEVANEQGKTHPVPFIMQVIEHRLMEAYFHYLDVLPDDANKSAFKKNFISANSTNQTGEIIYNKALWGKMTNKSPEPHIKYFADMDGTLKPIYHLYYSEELPNIINFTHPILHHPGLSCYGDCELIEHGKDFFNSAGYILNTKRELVNTKGFVFRKSNFLKEYEILFYDRHPVFDQMFFFEIASVFNKKDFNPSWKRLLDSAGGIKKLDEDKFIFIPTPDPEKDAKISPSMAQLLLPYLYELKEEAQNPQSEIGGQIGWIDETIEGLKTVLVEDMLAQEDKSLDKAVPTKEPTTTKSLDLPIPEGTEKTRESTIILQTFPEKNVKIHQRKGKKKERKHLINKEEKSQETPRHRTLEARKEEALAKIEEDYKTKASRKKNFSRSDLQELLGELIQDFSTLNIQETGKVSVRGSHTALQVRDKVSGNQTELGIARRPQKHGYQSGTVKTIVKDMIQKVRLIMVKGETSTKKMNTF